MSKSSDQIDRLRWSYTDLQKQVDKLTEKIRNKNAYICSMRDSVVTVTSVRGDESKQANGFFIRGHYIITTSNAVTFAPESNAVTFAPESNVVTFIDREIELPERIIVTVEGNNYPGKLVGMDYLGGVAILICESLNIENITVLNWGKSRNMCPGSKAMLIGNYYGPNNVLHVVISDNRYVCNDIPGELLLLSGIDKAIEGAVILDHDGCLIGMSRTGQPNVAISEIFMRKTIKSLLRVYQDNSHNDPKVQFYKGIYWFVPSTLGLNGHLFTILDCLDADKIIGY